MTGRLGLVKKRKGADRFDAGGNGSRLIAAVDCRRLSPSAGGHMDRLEAMRVFIAALDEGSLAGAGRKLGRSPAAVSRAIAYLESHVGAELLHRTTRTLKLSEIGERYAESCRRVLMELDDADRMAAGEQASPTGMLAITAPPIGGEEILRPVIDAFLEAYPAVSVNLVLVDRAANLVEE